MLNQNYKEITSFEKACEAENLDAVALVAKWNENGEAKHHIAGKMWEIFLKAINGAWVADFSNPHQKKCFMWVWVEKDESKPAGFRVVGTYPVWTGACTNVGSRLCCETHEQYRHALEHGEQMYLEMNLS